jgi:pimeloyl-ACP methyl ester carboxylesterase
MSHLPEIRAEFVETSRLRIHYLSSGNESGLPVIFVHGNSSSSAFWEESMVSLTTAHKEFRAIALDLRGYGDTEQKLLDATKGFQDFVDDISAFTEALNIRAYHIVGHSLGEFQSNHLLTNIGGAILYKVITSTEGQKLLSATLVCPGSPYGYGGTKDVNGTPNFDDFAGSGAGIIGAQFVQLIGITI